MALSTADDYKNALNWVIAVVDKSTGFDAQSLRNYPGSGVTSSDLSTILTDYETYRIAQASRINGIKKTTAK